MRNYVTIHRNIGFFSAIMCVFIRKKDRYLQRRLDVCAQVGHRGRGSIRQASLVVVQCAVLLRVFHTFHVDYS